MRPAHAPTGDPLGAESIPVIARRIGARRLLLDLK